MPERKLTREEQEKFQEIRQKWIEEVEQFFDGNRHKEKQHNQLDGSNTWGLAAIEQKYKNMINEELGMDFYKDKIEKSTHKKFSDLVLKTPEWLPKIPSV